MKKNGNCIHCPLTISFECNSNYPSKRLSIRSTFPSLHYGVHRLINNHHSLIAAIAQVSSQPHHHTSIGQASSQSHPTLLLLSSSLLHWLADIFARLLFIVWLMREALHCRCNIQEYILLYFICIFCVRYLVANHHLNSIARHHLLVMQKSLNEGVKMFIQDSFYNKPVG